LRNLPDNGTLEHEELFWKARLRGIPEADPVHRLEKFLFRYPQAPELALLTAFCELLAAHAETIDIVLGVLAPDDHTVLGLRLPASQVAPSSVRTALLDALEHRRRPPTRNYPAMFLPGADGGTQAQLTLTAGGFEYDASRFSAQVMEEYAAEFLQLLNPLPPIPDRLQPSEAIAVQDAERALTYSQLLSRSRSLATGLMHRGAAPGTIVAIELERSVDLPVAILAIWHCGAAYLPIDPAYPEARKRFLFEDSGALFRVTAADLGDIGKHEPAPFTTVNPDSTAYVIYTSGSTGEPKGVPITHRSFANFLDSVHRKTGISERDRFLAVTTLAFDISAMELFLPLATGATLSIATREEAADGRQLARLITQRDATFVFGTPATWRMLLDAGWNGKRDLTALCGGDSLTTQLAEALLAGTRALWNMFGPTETTVASTMVQVIREMNPVPIGKALSKTQLYVTDVDGNCVPTGTEGELWIGGVGVASGYLNRPELTNAKFTADGRFRTGDMVRFLPDGNLEFLGRADDQIKIRGFRVELGEIEAALLRCQGVQQAVVLARRDGLAAFIAPMQSTDFVRRQLADILPPHLLLTEILALSHFPLTPNGKVDRRSLAESRPESTLMFEPPAGPIEKALAQIFGEVLQSNIVSATGNFFHLGGHSLLATQVLSRVWEMWRVEMSTRELFDSPTVRELAIRIQERQTIRAPSPAHRVRNANPPLSFAQERVWFLDEFHQSERALYNIPAIVRLTGPLDPVRFERALNQVIARHEPLRASFRNEQGSPVQTINAAVTMHVPIREVAESRQAASLPFDLPQAPLLRASLATLGANQWELSLTMHHIVSDGWSMGVLFRDLSAAYRGRVLPPLTYRYSDYAAAQRENIHAFDKDLDFWRKQLSNGVAPFELPTDRPRGAMLTYRGAQHRFAWSANLSEALIAFSRSESVTPFQLLLAAFYIVLYRYTGGADLTVGTPVANRSRVEREPLIGFFVNTLPLRIRIAPEHSFRHVVENVKQIALDAFAHAEIPFQHLVTELQPDRTLAHSPFFQVMFALQNAAPNGLDLPDITASETLYEPEWVKLDLSVNIEQIEPVLRGSVDYNRDLFDADRMQRLTDHLAMVLEAGLHSPDAEIGTIPLLTEREREWLDLQGSPPPIAYPECSFPEVFHQQVTRRPDAIAVQFEGATLTYAELDQASQPNAAGPAGTLVPLVVERDLQLVPRLLAIWKAHSAYVPIDPENPPQRQQSIREDIGDGSSAGSLAYVIYTSGSTGDPKGVRITQRSVINLLGAMQSCLPMDETDVMVALASVAFDMSVPEIWLPLYCGAKLVLASSEDHRDPVRLRQLMEGSGATIMQGTPTLWAALLDAGWFPEPTFKLLVGAEPLPQSIAARLAALPCQVWNMYGPTETTVWSTMARVKERPVTIGRPLANTRLFVLDDQLQRVPIGVPGELYIAGDGLADGYWNRPELTAHKFVNLPNGERAFRTGDRVRYLPDGQLEFHGRADGQVKLYGFRIELGEIEAALERHPSVTRASATLRQEEAERKYLAAYYTGQSVSEAVLREALESTLPPYMVPSRFMHLEALPLSANGKVDRGALPVPAEYTRAAAPSGTAEDLLQNIFATLLKMDSVSPDQNFFHLGGHSLLAARAMARIRDAFGIDLPLRALFEAPSPRGLARMIALSRGSEPFPAVLPIASEDTAPLSFAQSRLWFLHRYYGGASSLYNIEEAFRIRGWLDTEKLLDCFSEVVRRHSTLRSRFTDAYVIVDPPRRLQWHEDALDAPFDLASEWPVRIALQKRAPNDFTLRVAIHHIVSDAWSFGILYRELSCLYADAMPAPLRIQYSDFAHWQREFLSGIRIEREGAWWRAQLAEAPPLLELPADRARHAQQQFAAGNHFFRIAAELTQDIHRLTRAEDVTLFMVLLAAFQVLLARYTQAEDIVVGSPTANRMLTDAEPLIGFFANTLVLRTNFAGEPDFRQALRRVREVALNAAEHQDLPFEKLVEVLAPPRTDSYTPVFQVLFILQNNEEAQLALPGLQIEREPVSLHTARFDLTLAVEEREGELHCVFNYSAALFDSSRMERMAGHFVQLLRASIEQPETSIWHLPLLTPQEKSAFETWNRTDAEFPAGRYPPSFSTRAKEVPNKVAVECDGAWMTYAELDQESTQLAHGFSANRLIPIKANRDLQLIPKLLAVWKAGSAYAPLDPDYPDDRLNFIRREVEEGIATPDLAYVIYTSGSTGRPKGVRIRHTSLLNLLEAMRTAVPMGGGDVMVALASAAFDMSIPELWLPLYCGAKLVLGTDRDRQDPERLRKLLQTSGATIMQATPTLWSALLDTGWRPAPNFKLLVGAEALPETLRARLATLGCTVWNLYGPTETTVWSTMARVREAPVAIGQPIANTRVFVLDSHRERVPIGIPGELYISGAGVADGYWNRPELTAERFPTLPSGERVYRTGDLVRFRDDGQLEFLRRLDTQVKLRGFRIELGEVEGAMGRLPRVLQAAAVLREGNLYAWYTGDVDQAELREHVAQLLPRYMVPARFFHVDALPLNTHGKLDRSALIVPALPEPSAAPAAPIDPLEHRLLPLWREALGAPEFSVTDNFFDFGGHSLSAMRLISSVEKATGQMLPFQTLFSAPTLHEVVEYLKRQPSAELPHGLSRIQAEGELNPIFFFHVHAGCWNLAHALGPNQPLLGVKPDADSATAIQARQPHGPYLLAAYGAGEGQALEAARELVQRGEAVSAVAIFDGEANRGKLSWAKLFRGSPAFIAQVIHFRSAKLPSFVFDSPAVEQVAEELRQLQESAHGV